MALGLGDEVGVGEAEGAGVLLGVAVGDGVGVGVTAGVPLGVGEGVGVGEPAGVGDGKPLVSAFSTRVKVGEPNEACFDPTAHKPPCASRVMSFRRFPPVPVPGMFSLGACVQLTPFQ